MTTHACIERRAQRLETLRQVREVERCLRCIAAACGLPLAQLRREAAALQDQFADAGITSFDAQLAVMADELQTPVEALRREAEAVMRRC